MLHFVYNFIRNKKQEAKVIWQGLHQMTQHSEAELIEPRDRLMDGQTDTVHIGNNSLHLMHSMQPNKIK